MDVLNVNDIDEMDFDELDELDFIINGLPRRVYERANSFYEFDDFEFFARFRLRKNTILQLLAEIEHRLEFPYDVNNCISPINQLLICLQVYATGGHLLSLADFGGVHVSSVSRIVVRVSEAIAELAPIYIKFPSTPEQIQRAQNSFYDIASFPRVIGVLDGTHIRLQSPGGIDAEIFRNRKSYFSVNLQVIGNANLEIIDIVARWPGSAHDSTIFNNSNIRRNFEMNLYPNSILLGDSGYGARQYLLTPLLNPTTEAEQLYNQAHIRTRTKVENIFGIWKRRFPILAYGCRLKLQTTLTLIVAAAVLHNIARTKETDEPPHDDANNLEQHVLQQLINDGQIPNLIDGQNQQRLGAGFQARRNLIDNFFALL